MSEEFLDIGDEVFTAVSANGETVRLGFTALSGENVLIEVPVGYLPKIIGRMLSVAKAADERRTEAGPVGTAISDMIAATAERPKYIRVGMSLSDGEALVGLSVHLSGIPFTLALSPQVAEKVSQELASAASGVRARRGSIAN